METNEITMLVDVKLTIHDKRPDYLRFRNWTRSTVRIEAVKCFPCFLRITIVPDDDKDEQMEHHQQRSLNVPIIVPGVTVSLASSRTKQHSFGLFWKQNRRDCFIYFAVDTEANCRRHIKWVKKSIRNLELYRQLLIEQRRSSRGPVRLAQLQCLAAAEEDRSNEEGKVNTDDDNPQNSSSWSRRVSHISNIYEEICEGNATPPRLSRRLSRASIASGIYEEMKCMNNSFNAISEEIPEPPPLPPLPMQRKRFNTFEHDNCVGLLGDIPRSNTNPECEMAKKKKYKKVLENIFGSGRSKRTKSVSESNSCSTEDIIDCNTPKHSQSPISMADTPLYANDVVTIVARKRHRKQLLSKGVAASIADSKRNSFSSPDLSKINFLDTFGEDKLGTESTNDSLLASSDDLDLSSHSLDESSILSSKNGASSGTVANIIAQIRANHSNSGSLESLNISQQIPHNFNFSACNTSTINLMGAHVAHSNMAAPLPKMQQRPELKMEELAGYCFMAPIKKPVAEPESQQNKSSEMLITNLADYCFMAPIKKKLAQPPESSSSGYSTGSYCSSSTSSSCTNSTEDHLSQRRPSAGVMPQTTPPTTLNEESVIYESMRLRSANESADQMVAELPSTMTDFTGNLYENLLTVKAAQELEQLPTVLTTSTPTDSPHTEVQTDSKQNVPGNDLAETNEGDENEEGESYYQTPRKSIISIDDKIPSYYPNSCDTVKLRRSSAGQSQSPTTSLATPNLDRSTVSGNSVGLRQLIAVKTHRERRDSQSISSPQSIHEQRSSSCTSSTATCTTPTSTASDTHRTSKSSNKSNGKKTGTVSATAAHKISDHIYTVTHPSSTEVIAKRKSLTKAGKKDAGAQAEAVFNDELKEKLQKELLTMAVLQNIDFKFDDTKALLHAESTETNEGKDENYYQTITSGVRSVTPKYINMSPRHITSPPQHPLKLNQQANQQTPVSSGNGQLAAPSAEQNSTPCTIMTQSKLEVPVTSGGSDWSSGVKKFASLPRFKKIDFSPLKLKINNVLQRNHHQQQQQQF